MTFTALIEQVAEHVGPPQDPAVTETAIKTFKEGLDRVNDYRGSPEPVIEGVQLFAQTESQPLFCAGMAYAHYMGAYVQGSTYDQAGIKAGWGWLTRAGDPGPARPELLVIKAFLEIHSIQIDAAKRTLDTAQQLDPVSYYALTALLDYAMVAKQFPLVVETYRKALTLALTSTRRAYLHHRMGRYGLRFKEYDVSIAAYQELAKLTPDDPWMWHNMSIIYSDKEQFRAAARCNAIALRLMEFQAARDVQRWLRHQRRQQRARLIRIAVGALAALVPKPAHLRGAVARGLTLKTPRAGGFRSLPPAAF